VKKTQPSVNDSTAAIRKILGGKLEENKLIQLLDEQTITQLAEAIQKQISLPEIKKNGVTDKDVELICDQVVVNIKEEQNGPPITDIIKLFPQFEILSLIGIGVCPVYKARQPGLDRFVALKVLPPRVANKRFFIEQFNREARALARLNHPNIVTVYDFGKAGALPYLLMEFVDGTNLRKIEQAGRLSPEKVLAIVPQICEALQCAHDEGIVHRDIKPENLLLDKKGRVKITDFSIAKILGVPVGKDFLTSANDMVGTPNYMVPEQNEKPQTVDHRADIFYDIVGTPNYMAPEQNEKPQTVDHRADIYSLGVVFYEMLTGELPWGKFAPPSMKADVDARLDEVVLHCLEKEPERRYQQASQVKADVETIASTAPPSADKQPKTTQTVLE
jgi:serine/threonine protein kinase